MHTVKLVAATCRALSSVAGVSGVGQRRSRCCWCEKGDSWICWETDETPSWVGTQHRAPKLECKSGGTGRDNAGVSLREGGGMERMTEELAWISGRLLTPASHMRVCTFFTTSHLAHESLGPWVFACTNMLLKFCLPTIIIHLRTKPLGSSLHLMLELS